jgi:hypothetical protein
VGAVRTEPPGSTSIHCWAKVISFFTLAVTLPRSSIEKVFSTVLSFESFFTFFSRMPLSTRSNTCEAGHSGRLMVVSRSSAKLVRIWR